MIASAGGSSPHTRGLQGASRRQGQVPGIIPAHAGFTPRRGATSSSRWDHPRTRGVYNRLDGAATPEPGSSPHTRGLPRIHETHALGGRIIPAHAGFTLICAVSAFTVSDHPRTRGVYPQLRKSLTNITLDHPRTRGVYLSVFSRLSRGRGSSPHTRGLQISQLEETVNARIIPAHAGFTGTWLGL